MTEYKTGKHCPPPDELSKFSSGQLPGDLVDDIGEHIEHCQSCSDTLALLNDKSDTLVTGLRQGETSPEACNDTDRDRVVKLIREVGPENSAAPAKPASESQPVPVAMQQLMADLSSTGLLTAEEVSEVVQSLPVDRRGDTQELAKALVRSGKLTKFQATAVYQGKTRGLVFGEYVVLDKIGAGGMGMVYRAIHRRMKREVAIKVLPGGSLDNATAIDRFYREVEAAAKLLHPNIVTAFDAGQHGKSHFLVMEYVAGQDLSQIVKQRGPLPVATAVEFIMQAAQGLEYAHGEGLVHRDIKPANLLVDKKGTVKILDMGLARLTNIHAADDGLTKSGQIMGTVDYMAPEQATNTRTADARADIYSLGCTLYRLLTDSPVFTGDTIMNKMVSHMQAPPPSLRAFRQDVPEALDAVYQRMLAKQPDARQQSMNEVIQQLRESMAGVDASLGAIAGVAEGGVGEQASDSRLTQHFQDITPTNINAPTSTQVVLEPTITLNAPVTVDEQAESNAQKAQVRSRSASSKPPRTSLLIGGGLAGFLLVAMGVWFIIRDKDGKEIARIKAQEGASVTMQVDPPERNVPADTKATSVPGISSRVPSALDNLDPAAIPAEERFEWQPKELVAVIGSHARRHWERPVAAAISPDGKLAATLAMSDGTFFTDNLIVWDLATQTAKWKMGVKCWDQAYLWFTPDSQRLVVIPRKERIHVYTLKSPKPNVQRLNLQSISNPESHHGSAILEQGRTLAIPVDGNKQFTLHTADWERGEISKAVSTSPPSQSKTRFFFANDANQALYVSAEGKLRRATIRNTQWEQDEELAIPLAAGEKLSDVASDGKRLTIQTATEFQIWNIAGATPQKHGSVAAPSNHSSQFSPDGRWLTIKYTGAELYRIDGAKPQRVVAVSSEGQGFALARIAFSADGNQAVCTNGASLVRFWNLAGEQPVELSPWDPNTAFGHSPDYCVRPIIAPADGRLMLNRVDQRRQQFWSLAGNVPLSDPDEQTLLNSRKAWSVLPAGPAAFVGLSSKYDPDGSRLFRFKGNSWTDTGRPFGPSEVDGDTSRDGKLLVLVQRRTPAELSGWDLSVTPPTQKWTLPIGQRENVGFYTRRVSIADNQRELAAFVPAETGKNATIHELLLVRHVDAQPEIMARIPVSLEGRTPEGYTFALSRDGLVLAHSRDKQNELILEDISGPQPRQLQSTKLWLYGKFHWLSFSPDGRHLACATDESVIVLEVATLKTVWKWDAPGDIEWIEWAEDGRHLITLNGNKTAYVLRLSQLAPSVSNIALPAPTTN
ncbi:MAG: protein kinase [Planctomycetaceae bacterium]|nr:protein kinase [Planctomycetaceae bacterium]